MTSDDATPKLKIERRHDLDALRAFAMLLGIALHGALAYTATPYWIVRDEQTHWLFDMSIGVVHGFRMPLFFLVSGFFTAMLWRKRGFLSLAKQRSMRILLPLIVFGLTILPLQNWIVGSIADGGWNSSKKVEKKVEQATEVSAETIWEAAKLDDVRALRGFVDEGVDLDEADPSFKFPPLNWAAINGSEKAVKFLVEAGAEVDVTIEDQSTPLSHAALMGHDKIVAYLLKRGANPNSVNSFNATPHDNTYVQADIAQWVIGMLSLTVDLDEAEKRREKCREILRAADGRGFQELEGAEEARGSLTGAYVAFTEWRGFHTGDVFGHLWFLWYLVWLFVPFAIYATVVDKLGWRGFPGWIFRFPVVLLWIVPVTFIPYWFNGLRSTELGPETLTGWIPMPHILVLYGVYFFFGALYYDSDDHGRIKISWLWPIPLVAAVPVYLMSVWVTFDSDGASRFFGEEWLRPLSVLTQALYPWLMIFCLIGFFQLFFRKERKVVRYVSDASYWLYVAHMPLIFVAQELLRHLELPAYVKFLIVTGSVTAILLLVYELCVRYTPLGTMLNGKRVRGGA
ncbi:MAG: acyltransferase family protein [Verrucomicrobiota bacterium]